MLRFGIFIFSIFLFLSISYAKECVQYENANVCVIIENQGRGKYSVSKDISINDSNKDVYTLSCKILTPDDKIQDLGACNKSFFYTGSGEHEVEVITNFQGKGKTVYKNMFFEYLTSSEYDQISLIYDKMPEFRRILTNKYSNLSDNDKWKKLSDIIYQNIDKFLSAEPNLFSSYSNFDKLFRKYIKVTSILIK